jgi:prepilin-type N-terminal cleavage/methylation domain-containing protein
MKDGNEPKKLNKEMPDRQGGFSLIELIISLVITLIILGIAVATFSSALSSRQRESSNTDAITSVQAALNIMSREIGNSGYGLSNNGIVLADSNENRLHFRNNYVNSNYTTSDPGEDVTFYYDQASQSVVRYDANTQQTSGIINRVSNVDFLYHNYSSNGTSTPTTIPTLNTGRVTIKLTVTLADVVGQPTGRTVTVESDVTLRNSTYMLGQY